MRIFVLGGTRFIGPPVLRELHAAGHELLVFHRGSSEPKLAEGIQRVVGDRCEPGVLAKAVADFKPEVALDMIPVVQEDGELLVEACRGIAQRLVLISSIDVYRNYGGLNGTENPEPTPPPLTEDSPLREVWYPYKSNEPVEEGTAPRLLDRYDKIPIERHVMSQPDLAGCVLRLPMVYGPLDYQHRMYSYLKRMDDGRPAIIMSVEQYGFLSAHAYVDNVAHAIGLAVTDARSAGRIYNVSQDVAPTEGEWVEAIGKAVGWTGRIVRKPDADLPKPLKAGFDPRYSLFSSSDRIRKELGFQEIVPFEEGLKRTVEWERANPPANAEPFDYTVENTVLAAS